MTRRGRPVHGDARDVRLSLRVPATKRQAWTEAAARARMSTTDWVETHLDAAAAAGGTTMVTDEQISKLRDEAAQAGDWTQVDVCRVALGDTDVSVTLRGADEEITLTQDAARAECARVIAAARAQE